MKRIAVITGASSGMGRQFAETLDAFGETLDEVWVIARRQQRLQTLQTGIAKRVLALDLSQRDSYAAYAAQLAQEKPEVRLLINCSGYGKFSAVEDTPLEENLNMVDLNCQAVQAMCQITLPYLGAGGKIVNLASVAACQPVPYLSVYAASKAFVLSYSRALNQEVRSRGCSVMAVCPFWTKTEFFDRATAGQKETVVKKYVAMYRPEQIVRRAWRDLRRGRDVSKFGFMARFQMFLCKLLPHRFVMWYWLRQQKL